MTENFHQPIPFGRTLFVRKLAAMPSHLTSYVTPGYDGHSVVFEWVGLSLSAGRGPGYAQKIDFQVAGV